MDYLPQDDYFEWEEVLGYSEATFSPSIPNTYEKSHPSYNIPTFSKGLELDLEDGGRGFEGFQWNDSSHESLSQFSAESSECTSPSNGSFEVEPVAEDVEEEEIRDAELEINFVPTQCTKDDTHVAEQPWRNIDYLSHEWSEEEVCASWKHLAVTHKSHEKITRLQNATWRSWTKVQNHLRVISPQSFNWLKDCDDTWLYGPSHLPPRVPSSAATPSSQKHIRPALKKHHISDVLIRGSVPSANTRLRCLQSRIPMKTKSFSSPQVPTRTRLSRTRSTSPARKSSWKGVKFLEEVEQYTTIEPIPTYASHLSSNLCYPSSSPPPQSTTAAPIKTIYKLPSTTLSSPADFRRERENAIPSRITTTEPASNLSEWMWLSDEDSHSSMAALEEKINIDAGADDLVEEPSVAPSANAGGMGGFLPKAGKFSGTISPPPPARPDAHQGWSSTGMSQEGKTGGHFVSRFSGLHIINNDDADDEEHEFLLNGTVGRRDSDDSELSMELMTPDRSSEGSSNRDETFDDNEEDIYFEGVRNGGVGMGGIKGGGYGFPMVGCEGHESYEEMMEEFNLILG